MAELPFQDNNDEIIKLLGLQDDIKYQVVTDLLSNGRQALHQYQEELIPKIYKKEINTADGQLLQLLKQYFDRQWHSQYDSVNQWFTSFITTYQNDKNPQQYERVLTRTAEHGNRYMKDCPVLSIVLQLLFELIDDECLLRNTTIFDDLWSTFTNEGLKSIGKYSNYMKEEVLNEEVDKHRSTLYRALCEYYRPRLVAVLKEHHIGEEEIDHDVALDRIAENGVKKGIDLIQQEIVTRKQKQVLSENLHSNEQVDENRTLLNTYSTPTTSNIVEGIFNRTNDDFAQNSTVDATIKVYVKRTGETIHVPITLVSTVRDVIKYVCENSVCDATSDYDDYFLAGASLENEQMLDHNTKLEDMKESLAENLEFQLCMKTSKESETNNGDEEIIKSNVPMFNNDKGFVVKSKSFEEHNNSSSNPDQAAFSLPVQNNLIDKCRCTSSKDDRTNLLQKEDLANNYHQLQKKIQELSEKITRDPILRQKIVEKFNEINIVVCGSPRVGKSALINALCQQKLARTSPGLHSCTNIISPYYLKGNTDLGDGTINYQYNFWDTPGFENWNQEAIRRI
ncbi:hypothetical protein I4U23_004738 [Adineta vaga]|nr:hypothetical protein I4U23_004738 [Adineta vaga]